MFLLLSGSSVKLPEPKKNRYTESIRRSRFSTIFCIPIFDPPAVPKQPQFISRPRSREIETANIKISRKIEVIKELSLTEIPVTSSIPAVNSTHGRITEMILIMKIGSSL